MAETMLLLVFCLLLVAAAVIAGERKSAEAGRVSAAEQIAALKAELETQQTATERSLAAAKRLEGENALLVAKLTSNPSLSPAQQRDVEKEWRELVNAREVSARFEESSVSPRAAGALAPAIKVMLDNGFDGLPGNAAAKRMEELVTAFRSSEQSKPHQWPPIISLSEADGYYFASGSARLSREFQRRLGGTAIQIAHILEEYNVDVVEVIGHTDERPLSNLVSNIDKEVSDVLSQGAPIDVLRPADNAGLGLARALSVVQALRRDPRLGKATILPMSAAQLVLPGDKLTDGMQSGDVQERRRIEIRVRRSPTAADSPPRKVVVPAKP